MSDLLYTVTHTHTHKKKKKKQVKSDYSFVLLFNGGENRVRGHIEI